MSFLTALPSEGPFSTIFHYLVNGEEKKNLCLASKTLAHKCFQSARQLKVKVSSERLSFPLRTLEPYNCSLEMSLTVEGKDL